LEDVRSDLGFGELAHCFAQLDLFRREFKLHSLSGEDLVRF
jgi:hypothetical protein